MSRADGASTTHHAILGLLAIRPFTPYELAKQFDRSLGRFWPRARSKLFEGPKRLVEMGLAKAEARSSGRRASTVYSITAKGRRSLAAWLAEPGAPPSVEFEQLMKVFFAEHGSKRAAQTNLRAAQAWARENLAQHLEVGRAIRDGAGAYPERAPQLLIAGRFLVGFTTLVESWATWALEQVDRWPDDVSGATADPAELAESVKMIERALRAFR